MIEESTSKNLANKKLARRLLNSSVMVVKFARESIWKDRVDTADLNNLRSAVKILEESIDEIVAGEMSEDANQLSLF